MNAEPGDVPRLFEAYVGPRVSSVGGFVDPVSGRDELPLKSLSRPRVDHIGIRERHVQSTHRGKFEELVRHVPPIHSGVGGLPDPAVGGSEVEHERVAGMPGHRNDTPSTVRTHKAPLEGRKKAGIHTGILGWLPAHGAVLKVGVVDAACQRDSNQ